MVAGVMVGAAVAGGVATAVEGGGEAEEGEAVPPTMMRL